MKSSLTFASLARGGKGSSLGGVGPSDLFELFGSDAPPCRGAIPLPVPSPIDPPRKPTPTVTPPKKASEATFAPPAPRPRRTNTLTPPPAPRPAARSGPRKRTRGEEVSLDALLPRPPKIRSPRPELHRSGRSSTSRKTEITGPSEQFCDRYAPKSPKWVIGNGPQVLSLQDWLRKRTAHAPSPVAALVLGPVGCGKTSAVRAVLTAAGFDLQVVSPATMTADRSLLSFIKCVVTRAPLGKPQAVVVDDIDAIYEVAAISSSACAGKRKGLVTGDLAGFLRKASALCAPLVFIAHDKSRKDVRTLASACHVVAFSAPSLLDLKAAASHVCLREKISLRKGAMDVLLADCMGDIRRMMHSLQLAARTEVQGRTDIVAYCAQHKPDDRSRNIFSVTESLIGFGGRPLGVAKCMELYDSQEQRVMQEMLHRNYVNAFSMYPSTDHAQHLAELDCMAGIADAYSFADFTSTWPTENRASRALFAYAAHAHADKEQMAQCRTGYSSVRFPEKFHLNRNLVQKADDRTTIVRKLTMMTSPVTDFDLVVNLSARVLSCATPEEAREYALVLVRCGITGDDFDRHLRTKGGTIAEEVSGVLRDYTGSDVHRNDARGGTRKAKGPHRRGAVK